MERRAFLNNLAKGAGTLIVLPAVLTGCEEEPIVPDNNNNGTGGNFLEIDLLDEQYSALNNAGGHVVRNNIIVINKGGQFNALSSVCTHTGCQVSYNSSTGDLPCPCHGSLFSINGSVLNGPADAPLKRYPVTREGDLLKIEL